jgi:hypothetical protein
MPDDPAILIDVTVVCPHAGFGGAEFRFDFTITH